MPRYVLLRHECPPDFRGGSHWDLMLEHEGVLRTWSLQRLPRHWGGDSETNDIAAERLADHRIAYLDYEGPVSGDRGEVRRVARGEFAWAERRDAKIEVRFAEGDLDGIARLTHDTGDRWRLAVDD